MNTLKHVLTTLLCLGSSLSAPMAYTGQADLPSWIRGDMNCKIDGRPAQMHWEVKNVVEIFDCDPSGKICSQTESAISVGKFSDNGGSWIPLQSKGTQAGGNTFQIRYMGKEQDNWQLTYDPATELAQGWTTWRKKQYPLECWKGETPLIDRCHAYATEAVQQYQAAQLRFCMIPSDGRWQDNYDAHYGWCMKAKGNSAWLADETKARSDVLANCIQKERIAPGLIQPLKRMSHPATP